MADTARMSKAAMSYASRGWPVLPLHNPINGACSCGNPTCASPAKHPRTPNGLLDATTEARQVFDWWRQWPDANIGIVTGERSGLVVIDLDIKTDGPTSWRDLLDLHGLVETLTSITGGGGEHWIFKAPTDTPLANTASKIGRGIDTRGWGGYIVAPPSLHISGQRYEWKLRVKPAPVPEWLLRTWPIHRVEGTAPVNGNHPAPTPNDEPWVTKALAEGAPEGQRNSLATRLVGYFYNKGMPRDVLLAVVLPFARKCQPPMELPELQKTINSVLRYQAHLRDADISDPPEFVEGGGRLVYTWPTPGASIIVDQLHRNNQGLQCEITIGQGDHLIHGPVHYNLTSTSGRETLVRYLNRRWEIDWPEILETLSRLTVAFIRTGDPVSSLREYLTRPAGQWTLRPFILDDQPTILFGPGGLGKSVLALAMMLQLESDITVLPGTEGQTGHHGLYLDWEDTEYQHGQRYHQLSMGYNLDPQDYELLHLRCTGTIWDQAQRINREISNSGVTYLIIDSAGMACGGEPEKSEAALMFFSALRTFKLPALVVAHQTKSSSQGMPFGSVFFHNSARMTWEIQSQQTLGKRGLNVALTNRKSNVSSLLGTVGYTINWGNDSISITGLDTSSIPELAPKLAHFEAIRLALLNGPLTIKAIADITGITEHSLRTELPRYKREFTQSFSTRPATWSLSDIP